MDNYHAPKVITLSPDNDNLKQQNGYTNAAYHVDVEPYQSKDDSIWTDLSVDLGLNNHEPINGDKEPVYDHIESDTTINLTRSTSLSGANETPKKPWYKCGRPRWASIKTFTFIICILQGVNGLLVTGYTVAVLTTIEKQFHIDSTISGFVISSYEIGSILSVVFVSYFGTHGHIPRWIGLGGLLLAVGSFLFALPQVLINYTPNNCTVDTSEQICNISSIFEDPLRAASGLGGIVKESISPTDCIGNGDGSAPTNYVYILIISQILLGIGGSPLLTLGTVYIDNNAEKSSSALYIAFMYIMMAIGPVCGFLLGAWFLQYYVDPLNPPSGMTPSSSTFIGLWWGGFVICGILYVTSSLPFLFFPRNVVDKAKQIESNDNKKSAYGRSWKKIPISIFRLATNSVYIITTINYSIVMTIVSGFTTFLPKYIETQFNLNASYASGLTGLVAVPGLCIGIYFGGWLIKRLNLEMRGVSILVLIVNLIAGTLLLLFFVFGCDNGPIAGLTTPYNSSDSDAINQNDQCNSICKVNCTVNKFDPICSGTTSYLSPCYAGCITFRNSSPGTRTGFVDMLLLGDEEKTEAYYGRCNCIEPLSEGVVTMTKGLCDTDCHMLIPFLVLLFIICLAASNNQMPSILITLRSVAEEEKAFALGVQIVVLRLLCYLPAPVMFGSVIDTSCILWTVPDNNSSDKTCLLYDIKKFRYHLAGVSTAFMAAGLICTVILCYCIRRRFSYSAPVTMTEIAQRVGDQKNLHISWTHQPDCTMRAWASDNSLYDKERRTSYHIHQKTRSC